MTAKEFMEGIKEQDSRVRMMREELHTVRERLDISGVNYENTGSVAATKKTDSMAELIAEMIDYESELKGEECRLATMRLKAVSCINKLTDSRERDVLRRWYLMFQNEEEIKTSVGYSRSAIYSHRRNGLEHLEKFGLDWTDLD